MSMIEVRDVSMRFNMAKERVDNLKEYFIKRVKGTLKFEEFYALKNVSLTVEKGGRLRLGRTQRQRQIHPAQDCGGGTQTLDWYGGGSRYDCAADRAGRRL